MLVTITACSGLKRQPELAEHDREATDTAEPKSTPAISSSGNQVESQDAKQESVDLLDRIRKSFSWKEVPSKYTDEYLRWNVEHPTYLANLFLRAEPFLFHIVEQIEQRGLPMELVLLPAVESAFKPEAISRSKAAGLWQFIPSTGRYLGLKRTSFIDERQGVIKSTETALDYLTFLNNEFNGDWYLTLAAYNGGIGTIQRAIKKQIKRNRVAQFHHLKLRSETERYVPKLLALRRIIATPDKYNVALPFIANAPYFAKFELTNNHAIDLRTLANKADIDYDQLKRLNAGYLQKIIPNGGQHAGAFLLVPKDKKNIVSALLSNQSLQPLIDSLPYKIKSGDNLALIAKRHNTTVAEIKMLNSRTSDLIIAGDTIKVPYQKSATESVARKAQTKKVHRVQAGDTLWSIARHYQVKLSELIVWNNISKHSILSLNQPLTIFVH